VLLLLFYALGLDSCVVINESYFESPKSLNVVYHLGQFYVMCYMCDDNNSCKCSHRNVQQP
jgi:hypothetical protein